MNNTLESRSPRRLPRFRLKTLVLVALFGGIFALIGHMIVRELHHPLGQRQAARKVERQGGYVRSVAEPDRKSGLVSGLLRHLLGDGYFSDVRRVKWSPRSEEDLDLLRSFPELTALHLEGTAISDVALGKLTGFQKLDVLSLEGAVISRSGLASLADLPSPGSVSFQNCSLSDDSLRALAELPNLRSLTFQDCGLSDDSLADLCTAPSLAELWLIESEITETGVLAIRNTIPALDVRIGHAGTAHSAHWDALFRPSSSSSREFIQTYYRWYARQRTPLGGLQRNAHSFLPCAQKLPTVQSLSFRGPFTSDATLAVLQDARGLATLKLERCRVTDDGLKNLGNLAQLTHLDLVGTNAPEASLSEVRKVPGFSDLSRSDCRITDRGLEHISNLSGLTDLTVLDCQVTDQGLESIGRLVNLTCFCVNGEQITDAGIQYLQPLKKLTELGLCETAITDQGARTLEGLTQLRELALIGAKIEGPGLGSLPSGIIVLILDQAVVTDEGLAAIARLTSLTYLSLKGTRVSDQAVMKLREALPKCRIVR